MARLSDLPDHVLAEIVRRLPVADALALAAVSAPARRDEPAWRHRAAALAGGAPLGAIADWGEGATWRGLVAGLLAGYGHLLAPAAWSCRASQLGTLVAAEAVPPTGIVASSLTPVSLGRGFHRAPLFDVAFTPGAPPSVRCRRPGRPPPGRGAVPEWHAAALWCLERQGGRARACAFDGPPPGIALTCVDGCRQSLCDANARLAAARGVDPGPDAAPGGARGPTPRAVALPELPPLADVAGYLSTMVRSWAQSGRRAPPAARAPTAPTPPPLQGALALGGGGGGPTNLCPVPAAPGHALAGLWKGTYGPHRLEVVRVGRPRSRDEAAAAAAAAADVCTPLRVAPADGTTLDAFKLLGDMHVPAAQESFRVHLAAAAAPGGDPLSLGARPAGARLRIPPGWHTDLIGLDGGHWVVREAWPATAVVAGAGFRGPATLPAQVALLEPGDAFVVAWGGVMRSVSLFVRVQDRELRAERVGAAH